MLKAATSPSKKNVMEFIKISKEWRQVNVNPLNSNKVRVNWLDFLKLEKWT